MSTVLGQPYHKMATFNLDNGMNALECLRRMPPLPTLRAFESAARHRSFAQAAQELKLTPAAIGSQVRLLEDHVGLQLFNRVGRGLVLTREGSSMAERLRSTLLDIASAINEVRRSADDSRLVLSVLPSFASCWLVPRIGKFIAQHPGLEIAIHASSKAVDFKREAIDLCIRFGTGNWKDLWSERLLDDYYYPVCAPDFLRTAEMERPHDILQHTLLNCIDTPWNPWFEAAGIIYSGKQHSVTYSDSVNLLQAAKEGQGIALARHTLTMEDIKNGRLVRLFSIDVPSPMSYYLVCTPAMAKSRKMQQFRTWLWSEILNYRQSSDKADPRELAEYLDT